MRVVRIAHAIARSVRRAGGRLVDRALGMETAAAEGHAALGFGPDTGGHYVATPWLALLRLRRALGRLSVSGEDVFVDYGSGKGRVVLVAARYPFKRVVGVEVSARLNRIAAANVRRTARRLACADVRLVTANAADYAVPPDATVFYLYNPFKHGVFRAVVDRICDSLAAAPRRVTIVYANPVMHDHLLARGFILTKDLGYTRVYTNAPAARFAA